LAGDIAEKKLIQPLLMKYSCLVGEKDQQGLNSNSVGKQRKI
jgi:hypothetical protein